MNSKPIPVTILSGFLGAGKTTLLNHVMTKKGNLNLAVIVNDFGSVNIDADLVKAKDETVMQLENGCICCSLAEGLIVAVMRILAMENRPDHIIVETSGISEPIDVARKFNDPELKQLAPINAIVTTIDAENILGLEGCMLELATQQVLVADIILVNKTDLVTEQHLKKVHQWCHQHNAVAKRLDVKFAEIDLPIIFDETTGTELNIAEDYVEANAGHLKHNFETYSYETDKQLSMQKLYPVLERLSLDIYRMKGILNIEERQDRQCVFQCTGQRATVVVGDEWENNEERLTRLVFIAPKGILERETISQLLDKTVA